MPSTFFCCHFRLLNQSACCAHLLVTRCEEVDEVQLLVPCDHHLGQGTGTLGLIQEGLMMKTGGADKVSKCRSCSILQLPVASNSSKVVGALYQLNTNSLWYFALAAGTHIKTPIHKRLLIFLQCMRKTNTWAVAVCQWLLNSSGQSHLPPPPWAPSLPLTCLPSGSSLSSHSFCSHSILKGIMTPPPCSYSKYAHTFLTHIMEELN